LKLNHLKMRFCQRLESVRIGFDVLMKNGRASYRKIGT
jgi:hypothetical protein